ncbi:hypothetical protein ABPG74_009136 [Tetrahymena malaccensis]
MDQNPTQNGVIQYERPQARKMSSRTLKQLEKKFKDKFAKPQTWKKDEDSKLCFICQKEFNFLYRRRHHCRKCANLFCSSCSNYFLSLLFDPLAEADKETRLCKNCFDQFKQSIEQEQKNSEEEESLSSEDDEESDSSKITNRIELKDQFELKLKTLIKYIFQQEKKLSNVPNFCDQYIDRTFNFTMYCLKNLRCRLRKQDNEKRIEKFHEMDINRFVIIKTCLHKDANQFTYVNGIINSKNVAKKNMFTSFGPKKDTSSVIQYQNQRSNNSSFDGSNHNNNGSQSTINQGVRCMIIGVSVDIFSNTDTNYPDLQQIIQKQRLYIQRIVEGIKQFKPQIIFCRENVNQDVLTQLEQEKITVVQKIKNNIILKIAECARCLIIDDISLILPQNNNQQNQKISNQITKSYIGNLYSVSFKTFQFATKSKTYMFLQQPEKSSAYHVSLLITGPELEILKQFKKNLQVILRLSRHLYLEQEIVYTNNDMINKNNKKLRKYYVQSLENEYIDFGNLNNFIDEKIGLSEYLYSDNQKFSYVCIQYKKVEWNQFDGVNSHEELEKYLQEKKINYENSKINTLVKYCGEYEHEQISFYQVKDISLADKLFSIYKERHTSCDYKECKTPRYNHYHLYIRNKCYIKLSISERLDSNIAKKIKETAIQGRTKTETGMQLIQQQKNQLLNSSKIKGDEQMRYEKYQSQQNIIQYQYHNNQRNHTRSPQKQQVEGLKKVKMNPKDQILQYILCEQCDQKITSVCTIIVGKTLTEYSFNRFLQHMFQEYSESYKKEKCNLLKDFKDIKEVTTGQSTVVQNKCTHQIRSRVFKLKDVEIKFQVGKTNVFSFSRLSFIPEPVQEKIRDLDALYYKEAFQNFKQFFKVMIADAQTRLQKLNDIVFQKKISKQQNFFHIIEMYKSCIERMESEKEHIIQQVDSSKIINYSSMIQLYILEQRMNIGLHRLNCLQKEIIQKKYKQFEKQHLDETIHQTHQIELDNSILDEEIYDLKEIDQTHKFKGYSTTLNIQEERQKDDQQTQPFEYIPVYEKNYHSMIAWALNTKQYCRFLKDTGLNGQKVSRSTLIEMLKKKNIDPNLDEKQKIEENKFIVKLVKSQELDSLIKYEYYFQNLNVIHKDTQLDLNKVYNNQDQNGFIRCNSEHFRSQSYQPTHITNNDPYLVNQNVHHSNFYNQTQNQNTDAVNESQCFKSKDDLTRDLNDTSNNEDLIIEQSLQTLDNNTQSGDDSIGSRNNLPEKTLPPKKIKQSSSGNNIKESLNNLFYKNGDSKSSQNNLVEYGQQQEAARLNNFKKKSSQNNLVEYGQQQLEIKKKSSQNNLVDYGQQQQELKKKSSQNNLVEYGQQQQEIKKKSSQNNLVEYGQQQQEVKLQKKSSQNNLVEYGQQQPEQKQSFGIKKKSSQNNLLEYAQNQEAKQFKDLNQSQTQNIHNQLLQHNIHSHSSNNLNPVNINQSQVQHRITHQSIASTTQCTNVFNSIVTNNDIEQSNVVKLTTRNYENSAKFNMGGSGNSGEKVSEVHILFAKQFEAFRNLYGISQERIIESLRTCAVIKLPGGQTQSSFVKSHDELFVVKEVSQLEFNYFQEFALQYLDHMSSNQNSLLAKMYGFFIVSCEGDKKYYAVMENIFYGMDKDNCQSYDLKGSKKRRFRKETDIGLDTNFMIDMNCEPFFIDNSSYQSFDKTIRSDSDFLATQDIVDYSLLLICDKNKKILRLGIIDYFRKYDLLKFFEKNIKQFVYKEDPTIVEPNKYKERFVKTLTKRFFCKV